MAINYNHCIHCTELVNTDLLASCYTMSSASATNDHLSQNVVKTHSKCLLYADKILSVFYWYFFGSIKRSLWCTCRYFQNKKNETKRTHKQVYGMNDFSLKQNSDDSQEKEESDMKRDINRHFRNHFEKWDQDQKFPWKGTLHLLLVALVTTQVST